MAFRAIRRRAIGESPRAFGSTPAEIEARPPRYWEERARQGAEGVDNVLLVADHGATWVGVVAGFLDDAASARGVDVVSMWVDPAYRGQGLGRALIEAVLDWARERRAVQATLWVTENNAPAMTLYRRAGFTETGDTQALPSHPELSEVKMVLDL